MKNILIAAALLVVSTSASANLITNGSFEFPGVTPTTFDQFDSIPGWTAVAPGQIEVRNNRVGTAQEGSNFVELDADFNSTMFQTINTTAGTVYELSYWYSPRIGQNINTNGISAFWNDTLLTTSSATGTTFNEWTLLVFNVIGSASGTDKLTFSAVGISDSLGGNLDNVQLNAVPVPAAAWLFGSALGLFGFARRRSI
ncbi:MAG: hypothetical protein CTY10_07030 [Methylotenera sp.]|nr:MAG: hypothetical protein CTY10_07030 [Methylotenera sp.]